MLEMPSTAHFLVTRFNVAHRELRDWPVRGLDEDWLNHRLPMFESVCAPSVAGQTTRAFRWLVFVHPATPQPFRTRIEQAVTESHGEVVWSETGDVSELRERIGTVETLITTRLDNDDAISRDFMEAVQRAASASGVDGHILNFTVGCQLQLDGWVYRRRHRSNPFLSLVEREGGNRTIWDFGTHVYLEGEQIDQLKTDAPMWLQNIHDRNVANPPFLGPPIRSAVIRDRFSIDPDVLTVTDGRLVALAVKTTEVGIRRALQRGKKLARQVVRHR